VVVTQLNWIIPSEESPDVRAVRGSVEGLVRSAVLSTINDLGEKGGYLSESDYQLGSVTLAGEEVPYWQANGEVAYPDKVTNLQEGVRRYLEDNIDSFAESLSEVEFGEPMVGPPTFRDDSITVSVTMPTTYRENAISGNYVVTVDTLYSQAYDFATGFALYESNNRPLEYYTLSSMALSPIENNHHSIPMQEVIFGCDDYLFLGSSDVIPRMESTIMKTLSNTYMPGKAPEGYLLTSSSPKYSLVPLGGKRYGDLDVDFLLPDDFSLDQSNFRMSPDPAVGIPEPIPLMGECMGMEPVAVSYTFNYPAVVSVRDPETGSVFQYAVHVSVLNNEPRPWSVTSTPEKGLQEEICSEPSCIMDLEVRDSSGNLLPQASVSFMGCHIGETDSSGYLASLAPCGSGTLYVYKRGYDEYLDARTSSELEGSVTLYRQPAFNVILHEVVVQQLDSGTYMVYDGEGVVSTTGDKRVYLTFRSESDFEERAFLTSDPSLTIRTVTVGVQYVTASLLSRDFSTLEGGLVYPYAVDEGLDGKTLHVYIPSFYDLNSLDDTARQQKIGELSQVLEKCGIGPVTLDEYVQTESCAVTLT
jgi:hypothetical protein